MSRKGKDRPGKRMEREYANFVEHPRFGRYPRLTGLNPETDLSTGNPYLHWHSPLECRIPGTAVAADLARQSRATLPVTHYYDVRRSCRGCGRPFIFFAEEQKHWYEVLGFPLEVDCVHCPPCRKRQQGIGKKRARYEELFHVAARTDAEALEMAECCLSLVEEKIFHPRQAAHVHRLINALKEPEDAAAQKLRDEIVARLGALEKADS